MSDDARDFARSQNVFWGGPWTALFFCVVSFVGAGRALYDGIIPLAICLAVLGLALLGLTVRMFGRKRG